MANRRIRKSSKCKSFLVFKEGAHTKMPAPPGIPERDPDETMGNDFGNFGEKYSKMQDDRSRGEEE